MGVINTDLEAVKEKAYKEGYNEGRHALKYQVWDEIQEHYKGEIQKWKDEIDAMQREKELWQGTKDSYALQQLRGLLR